MGLDLEKAARDAKAEGAGARGSEIEITPEMIEAGADLILQESGVADFGVFFDARDLAKRVYLAMGNLASSKPDQATLHNPEELLRRRDTT